MDDTVTARSPLAWMLGLIKLMSPKQWGKNGIVLAPLVSSGTFMDAGVFNHTLLAVLLCCSVALLLRIAGDLHHQRHARHRAWSSTPQQVHGLPTGGRGRHGVRLADPARLPLSRADMVPARCSKGGLGYRGLYVAQSGPYKRGKRASGVKDESRPADAAAIHQSIASRIPVRSISLLIVVTVIFYVGVVTLADWDAFAAGVSALPSALWVQVVSLSCLSYLLRFARWHCFISALGHRVPLLRNLEVYLAAFALTLTPGKAGETVRSIYLHPYGVSYPHSLGAFLSERLLDLLVVGTLASFAVSMFPKERPLMLAAIGSIAIVFLLLRSRLLTLIGRRVARSPVVGHAENVVATVRFLLSRRRLAVAAPLSLMAWMAQGIAFYLIVQALGYQLTASTVVAIYCLSLLAGAVSFIPGGLGATEAAIVLLLSAAGVGQMDAITASLVSRSLTLWLAVGIGVVAMTIRTVAIPSVPSAKRGE